MLATLVNSTNPMLLIPLLIKSVTTYLHGTDEFFQPKKKKPHLQLPDSVKARVATTVVKPTSNG